MSRYLKTVQKPYIRFRNGVTGTESIDLTTSGGTHTSFFADGLDLKSYKMGAGDNGVQFAFEVTAAGNTATVVLYAKPHGSDLEYIGEYDLTKGTMASDKGNLWMSTIVLDNEEWEEEPVIIDTGNDRMARIKIDGTGAEYILCIVTAISGGALSCYARGY